MKVKEVLIVFILSILFANTIFANSDRALKLYRQKYAGERKLALVIGNSNYDNKSLSKLKNPINDSRAVRDKLRQKGFEVLYEEDINHRRFDKIVANFTNELKNSKIGLFYFAGHGIEVDKQNYLIPIGANILDIDDIKYEALAVNKIVDKMKRSGTRLNMIILDACRNNPFKRGSGGLASMSNAKGTLIAFATSSGSTASDNPNGKNGLFTKHFLKVLDEPLNQREFFYKVRMSVYKSSGEKQLPYLNDGTIGDFYFTVTDKITYQKRQTKSKSSLKADEILWKEIANSKNIEDFKYFIDNYPNSSFVSVAKFKIKKLTAKPIVTPTSVGKINNTRPAITDATWRDSDTNLIWQVKINKKEYNWKNAKRYCKTLSLAGYDDWRLPTRKELRTILTKKPYKNHVSYSGETYIKKPLLKSMNMKYQWFWSSTKYKYSRAWVVNFYGGSDYHDDVSGVSYVRCVRGGSDSY